MGGGQEEVANNSEKRRANYEKQSERIKASLEKAEQEMEDASALKAKLYNLVDCMEGSLDGDSNKAK